VLDVGAGDAFFASTVESRFGGAAITCVDSGYGGATPRGHASIRFLTERPSDRFDLVVLLDVLEHIEHDDAWLTSIVADNLRNDGFVVVSVPSWPALFSPHDVALGHFRRYTPQAFRNVLTAAGLELVKGGGLFHSLLLPRLASAAMARARRESAPAEIPELCWNHSRALGAAVEFALRIDNRASSMAADSGLALPGLSEWAVARKATTTR